MQFEQSTQRDHQLSGLKSVLIGFARYGFVHPEEDSELSRKLSAWETEFAEPSYMRSFARNQPESSSGQKLIRRHKKRPTQAKIVTQQSQSREESPQRQRLQFLMKSVDLCKRFKVATRHSLAAQESAIHKSPLFVRQSMQLRTTQKQRRAALSSSQLQKHLPMLFSNLNSQTYLPHQQSKSSHPTRQTSPFKGKSFNFLRGEIKQAMLKGAIEGPIGKRIFIKDVRE